MLNYSNLGDCIFYDLHKKDNNQNIFCMVSGYLKLELITAKIIIF